MRFVEQQKNEFVLELSTPYVPVLCTDSPFPSFTMSWFLFAVLPSCIFRASVMQKQMSVFTQPNGTPCLSSYNTVVPKPLTQEGSVWSVKWLGGLQK